MRILVADDHLVYRIGIRSLISSEPALEIVGEAADGVEAIELYQRLRPDVLLLDLRMPRKRGVEVVQTVRREFPKARILIVTSHETEEDIFQVLQAGALGCILKDLGRESLIQAIQAVFEGKRWLSKSLERQCAERESRQALTPREMEVLELLARGLTNREIATVFRISASTVKNHVNNLLAKLEVADRTEAVSYCLAKGIVRAEDI